ncbi:MAG: hypothetical protein JKX81_12360 [Arenicella sp.]|nr:hypothetical protein [Arenicella sp.]
MQTILKPQPTSIKDNGVHETISRQQSVATTERKNNGETEGEHLIFNLPLKDNSPGKVYMVLGSSNVGKPSVVMYSDVTLKKKVDWIDVNFPNQTGTTTQSSVTFDLHFVIMKPSGSKSNYSFSNEFVCYKPENGRATITLIGSDGHRTCPSDEYKYCRSACVSNSNKTLIIKFSDVSGALEMRGEFHFKAADNHSKLPFKIDPGISVKRKPG